MGTSPSHKKTQHQAPGVRNFTWHDLRHTFGSRLAMEWVPIRNIAALMGHSNTQTTMRYAHLQDENLDDSVERLARPKKAESGGQTAIRTATRNSEASKKVG